MDIERLVEDGARAFCRSGKFESGQGTCSLLCMEFLGDVRKSGCSHSTKLHGTLARAVLAIALRAAAEEAKGPYPSTSKYDDRSVFYGSDLNPDRSEFGRGKQAGREAAGAALRTLAAQLGGDNG